MHMDKCLRCVSSYFLRKVSQSTGTSSAIPPRAATSFGHLRREIGPAYTCTAALPPGAGNPPPPTVYKGHRTPRSIYKLGFGHLPHCAPSLCGSWFDITATSCLRCRMFSVALHLFSPQAARFTRFKARHRCTAPPYLRGSSPDAWLPLGMRPAALACTPVHHHPGIALPLAAPPPPCTFACLQGAKAHAGYPPAPRY